jgi:maleylpyruvate isomerase
MFAAARFKLDMAPFPALRAINAACREIQAFQLAHPVRQPDAE